jgi:hypothetical protein
VVKGEEGQAAIGRSVLVALVLLLGCSSIHEVELPLRPDEVPAAERRAFECFQQQLPSLLRDANGLDAPDHRPHPYADAFFTSPANWRYYVRDRGQRVEFFAHANQPPLRWPDGTITVCFDSCGAFVVSYPKDAKDCDAKPEGARWPPR